MLSSHSPGVKLAHAKSSDDVTRRFARVAIVGTGFVGSTAAYALLLSGIAAEIILVDKDQKHLEGHLHDLRDAALFSHTTRVVAGSFSDCCDADVVIITAGVSQAATMRSRLENLAEGASILRSIVLEIACHDPHGVLLLASNPVDVLTYAAWNGRVCLLGESSAPELSWIRHAFAVAWQSASVWLRRVWTLTSSASMEIARCPCFLRRA